MYLITGLGNPGNQYAGTWHNLGAQVVQELADRWHVTLLPGKGKFLYATKEFPEKKVVLMIPTAFMNRSGAPVSSWVHYYKVPLENLLVIFDDHDLPLGKIRLRKNGSSGGHRGLEDIILRLNSDSVPRLRIGIQTDKEHDDLAHQVLSKIPSSVADEVNQMIRICADAVEKILNSGFPDAMNYFNGLKILDQ